MKKHWPTTLTAVLTMSLIGGNVAAAVYSDKCGVNECYNKTDVVHLCDSVHLASAGRLDIKPFPVDRIIPAAQSLDAVSLDSAAIGRDWKGKQESFTALDNVPFGLELSNDSYSQFNQARLSAGQVGQDMGIYSNQRTAKINDLRDIKVRSVGWYKDILNSPGASGTPMVSGGLCLSPEHGVFDDAYFSAPAISCPIVLDDITSYTLSPGDGQNLIAQTTQKHQDKVKVAQIYPDTLFNFNKKSQEQFKKDFEIWKNTRKKVTPWSYGMFS